MRMHKLCRHLGAETRPYTVIVEDFPPGICFFPHVCLRPGSVDSVISPRSIVFFNEKKTVPPRYFNFPLGLFQFAIFQCDPPWRVSTSISEPTFFASISTTSMMSGKKTVSYTHLTLPTSYSV